MEELEIQIEKMTKAIIEQGLKVKHIRDFLKENKFTNMLDNQRANNAHLEALNELFDMYNDLDELNREYAIQSKQLFI